MTRIAIAFLVLCSLLPPTGPASRLAQDTSVVNVSGIDLRFDPTNVSATQGQTIRFTNNGNLHHNLIIEGYNDADAAAWVAPGQSRDLVIPTDFPPGVYIIYCGTPGHREAGMVGSLNVSASPSMATPEPLTTDFGTRTPPFAAPLGVHSVGEFIHIGSEEDGYGFTITDIRTSPQIDLFYRAPLIPQGQFVIVDFALVIEQYAPAIFDFNTFEVIDGQTGQSYHLDATDVVDPLLAVHYDASLNDQLQPGQTYQRAIAFDIPTVGSELWLTSRFHDYLIPLNQLDPSMLVSTPIP